MPTHCEGDVLVFCSVLPQSVMGNVHRRDCQEDGKSCFEKDGDATCVTDKEPCDPLVTKAVCVDGRPTICSESIAGLHHLQAGSDCGKEGMSCVVSPKGWAGCVHAEEVCDPKTFHQKCLDDDTRVECKETPSGEAYPVRALLRGYSRKCSEHGMRCAEVAKSKALCVWDATPCDPATFSSRCVGEWQKLGCHDFGDGLHYPFTEYAKECTGADP